MTILKQLVDVENSINILNNNIFPDKRNNQITETEMLLSNNQLYLSLNSSYIVGRQSMDGSIDHHNYCCTRKTNKQTMVYNKTLRAKNIRANILSLSLSHLASNNDVTCSFWQWSIIGPSSFPSPPSFRATLQKYFLPFIITPTIIIFLENTFTTQLQHLINLLILLNGLHLLVLQNGRPFFNTKLNETKLNKTDAPLTAIISSWTGRLYFRPPNESSSSTTITIPC